MLLELNLFSFLFLVHICNSVIGVLLLSSFSLRKKLLMHSLNNFIALYSEAIYEVF